MGSIIYVIYYYLKASNNHSQNSYKSFWKLPQLSLNDYLLSDHQVSAFG